MKYIGGGPQIKTTTIDCHFIGLVCRHFCGKYSGFVKGRKPEYAHLTDSEGYFLKINEK
jgi:hypothetical protein